MEERKRKVNILMMVLAFMSFSTGIWSNYRGLWLQTVGFNITDISRIISVGLVCSAVISFVISSFSTKIKVKNVITLAMIFRIIAMITLMFVREEYIIKTCMLLGIMCEYIFSISYYPLLSFIDKSDETYKRKNIVNYVANDIAVIGCGLLIGFTLGKFVFDYETCLLLSTACSIAALIFLLLFKDEEVKKKKESITLVKSIKSIFKDKINNIYLLDQLFVYISYGIVFDLMMIILTEYIGFEVSFSSVLIIACNFIGTVLAILFNKHGTKLSISISTVIKYGSRTLAYLIAFLMNNRLSFIIAIIVAYVSSRILDNKTSGVFIERVEKEYQFLFSNIRYFAVCVGEGIGAFLAGVLLGHSIKVLFLGAFIFTLLQTLVLIYLDKLKKD